MGNAVCQHDVSFPYPQELVDLKDQLLSEHELHRISFIPNTFEGLQPSDAFMSELGLDRSNVTHVLVAKALLTLLNKLADRTKSSLTMNNLTAYDIVYPTSRLDRAEEEMDGLHKEVDRLKEYLTGVKRQLEGVVPTAAQVALNPAEAVAALSVLENIHRDTEAFLSSST